MFAQHEDDCCTEQPGLAQVFEPKEWAALMGKSILPKLAYCLDSEFAVNPVDQQLEAWEWAMSWAPVLPR